MVPFKVDHNLQTKIHWEKQGPCHILGSKNGINLKFPSNKKHSNVKRHILIT